MIHVNLKDNSPEAFEKMIRTFKKICQKDGFIQEIRERRYFEKPSAIRHKKEGEILREQKRERNRGKKN